MALCIFGSDGAEVSGGQKQRLMSGLAIGAWSLSLGAASCTKVFCIIVLGIWEK
jgi:hypothetical protein